MVNYGWQSEPTGGLKGRWSIGLSICLSTCVSVYLSICLSIYLCIRLSISLAICLSIGISIYLSMCRPLSIYRLSVYLSIYLCLTPQRRADTNTSCFFSPPSLSNTAPATKK